MNVLIVEDDKEQSEGLSSILSSSYDNIHCIQASGYDEAVDALAQYRFQLFILDIGFGGSADEPDGVALGSYIRSIRQYSKTPLLYVTASAVDAPRAIHDTKCYDFLVKPYSKEDLIHTMDTLIADWLLDTHPVELRDTNGVYFRVYPEKIRFVEANGKSLTVHTVSDSICTTGVRLKELAEKLPPNFIQCHKSFIVNAYEISSCNPTASTLRVSGYPVDIPIGRKYKEAIVNHLRNHL